jgi:hypothetical protein
MSNLRLRQSEGQKLVKVRLSDVDLDIRRKAAERVRDRDWAVLQRDALDPNLLVTQKDKFDALLDAVLVQRAALRPSNMGFTVSESARDNVLGEIVSEEAA